MISFSETALGRVISTAQKSQFAIDAILKSLYDFRLNPLTEGGSYLDLDTISTATSLSPKVVEALCEDLVDEGLIEKQKRGDGFRMRGKGVRFIMDLPKGFHGLNLS